MDARLDDGTEKNMFLPADTLLTIDGTLAEAERRGESVLAKVQGKDGTSVTVEVSCADVIPA